MSNQEQMKFSRRFSLDDWNKVSADGRLCDLSAVTWETAEVIAWEILNPTDESKQEKEASL
jgi:hypothetical protein